MTTETIDQKDIKNRVLAIIQEQLSLELEEIKLESRLIEDFEVDSLDTVELLICLEDEFGIEISDEKAETLLTVQDIIEHVSNLSK